MKKAKTPSELLGKASDFLSILNSFTGNKKNNDKTEPKTEDKTENDDANAKKKEPEYGYTPPQNNIDTAQNPAVSPVLPPVYSSKAYQHIVEKHDKRVKDILKKHNK